MDARNSAEDEASIHVQFEILPTIFEPQQSIDRRNSGGIELVDSVSSTKLLVHAPEKNLTLFALRLAVLEKAASNLGYLGFIWATVVLLGGFASALDSTDFWFITIILLIQATHFSRSFELEMLRQNPWSSTGAGINDFRAMSSVSQFLIGTAKAILCRCCSVQKQSQRIIESTGTNYAREPGRHDLYSDLQGMPSRTWKSSDVSLLPFSQWVFHSRSISKLLYWLQLLSATACQVLSLQKLIRLHYGQMKRGGTDERNREAALFIFYALALAEALLFLLEKAYWEWQVRFCRLLDQVNVDCGLGRTGIVSIKRFLYVAYSKCVNGSIFDGLELDMITFSMDLLASNSLADQLIGLRTLRKFAVNERFSEETLQEIGLNLSLIERLVEMLNWTAPQVEEIRQSAAEIVAKLAGKRQNSLRIAGIPGALESISSLLHVNRSPNASADEIGEGKIVLDSGIYSFWTFNHLGLLILKKLARDSDNCGKIGNTRGLLPKILEFTHAEERLLKDPSASASLILRVKRSLQVLKMLTSTTGTTGNHLRREISELIFIISNIRDILQYGEAHPRLQKHGIDILTNLSLDEDAKERIGGTGRVLKELFNHFFKEGMPEHLNHVRSAAGETLAMLSLESKNNCYRISKLHVLERLVGALEVPLLRVNAARILRNLCAYSDADCFNSLKGATDAAPTVLQAIMSEENKLLEVMLGLAASVFKFMTSQEASIMFEKAGVTEAELAYRLVQILKQHKRPPIKIPKIRRFATELAIWMMRDKATNVPTFKELGMENVLVGVLETTAELESFSVFSGTVGLSRHSTTMHSLVETALRLLEEREDPVTGYRCS